MGIFTARDVRVLLFWFGVVVASAVVYVLAG
jgi:hypothetical protein